MSRRDIHYWKCDRPAAFFGTGKREAPSPEIEQQLQSALERHFQPASLTLEPGCGQGNHLTWNAEMDGNSLFVRVENGPEQDDYLEMESAVLDAVAAIGVRVPHVFGCDATRANVPFAWQALERFPSPDLNHWYREGTLDSHNIAFEIGRNIATWQRLQPPGFGPFDLDGLRQDGELRGLHSEYATWFYLRLDRHLGFLVDRQFLSLEESREIASVIAEHDELLRIEQGCLVHKDMALWNILGERSQIAAFIDFDDAISGDAMDDLSLLACFHDAAFVGRAVAGYQTVRDFPDESRRRLWLHLLRNLLVKAVIRVGAGYFDRDGGLFLIGPGGTGTTLKQQTEHRIATALRGLRTNAEYSIL